MANIQTAVYYYEVIISSVHQTILVFLTLLGEGANSERAVQASLHDSRFRRVAVAFRSRVSKDEDYKHRQLGQCQAIRDGPSVPRKVSGTLSSGMNGGARDKLWSV